MKPAKRDTLAGDHFVKWYHQWLIEMDASEKHTELESSESQLNESMSTPIHELRDTTRKPELMDTPIMELHGDTIKQELHGGGVISWVDHKIAKPRNEAQVHELP